MSNKKGIKNNVSFNETMLQSPITEVALGIMAHQKEEFHASGTAIIIAPHLAITAQHVISDFNKYFVGSYLDEPGGSEINRSFHLQVFQILDNGKSGLLWNVTRLWACNYTDIAILRLTPTTKKGQSYRWKVPQLDLVPPKVGQKISAFGYKDPKILNSEIETNWIVDSRTATGIVIEVHDICRDSCRLPFPCFQTNARFDGAMSGGPVFNEKGCLCGIICSNLPPLKAEEEHTSYVTSLWPIMATKIDVDREGYAKGIKYPLLDLAADGIIKAENWEKVKLSANNSGDIVNVGLKKS